MHKSRARNRLALSLLGTTLLCACGDSKAAPAPVAAAAAAPATQPARAPANQQRKPPADPTPASKPAPAVAEKPAAPQKLLTTLPQLANRRDLWPPKIHLTKKVAFSASEVYPAGRELVLVEFAGSNLHVETPNGMIEIPAASTDVLERASALMASLSPAQLALTAQTLPSQPALWPVELQIAHEIGFSGGKTVPAGRTVQLRGFEGDQLNVYDREFQNYYTVALHETDLVARARERLALPESERTPFFLRSVGAALQPTGDAARDARLAQAEYVLVYEARLGCERCAQFLPHLKEFYERVGKAHANFEVVFVSQDFKAQDAQALDLREHLPGRIVDYEKRLQAAELGTQTQNGDLLPLVWLYDREGKVVARNQQAGGKPSADELLATLEKKLGEKR